MRSRRRDCFFCAWLRHRRIWPRARGIGNIVGLKPTVGSVSARGMVPACRSIDTISVFARSVDEALAVQRVMAGFDAEDPYSRAAPFPHLRRGSALTRVAMADVVALCEPDVAA